MQRSAPLKRKPRRRRASSELTRCDFWVTAASGRSWRCTKQGRAIIDDNERYCLAHATAKADKLIGDAVKERDEYRCMFALHHWNDQPCSPGVLSACHLIGKGAYPATRWEIDNIVSGCPGHHASFDNYDLGADLTKHEWAERLVGTARWEELREQARRQKGEKAADVIRRFREAA